MSYKIQIDNEIFEATPEQVIEIEARQLNAENELKARLALELNQFDDAKRQYLELFRHRKSVQYLYSIAYCEYNLGNLQEATKRLRELLLISPAHKRHLTLEF